MKTEWGVRSPWGTHSIENLEKAITTANNMRTAGHEASVMWRGVTEWQEAEHDHDD